MAGRFHLARCPVHITERETLTVFAFLNDILAFFFTNVPNLKMLAIGGPPALAWAFACLAFAGHLKKRFKRKR